MGFNFNFNFALKSSHPGIERNRSLVSVWDVIIKFHSGALETFSLRRLPRVDALSSNGRLLNDSGNITNKMLVIVMWVVCTGSLQELKV